MSKTGYSLIAIVAPLLLGRALEQEAPGPAIEWRFARETPAPGYVYMAFAYPEGRAGQPMPGFYVENRTVLTVDDFRALEWTVTEAGLNLDVLLKQETAVRMARETEARLGQYFVALVNSRLVSAAKLIVVIGEDPDLPIFIGLRLPQGVATETAARLQMRPVRPTR